jgi:hypothetical protein
LNSEESGQGDSEDTVSQPGYWILYVKEKRNRDGSEEEREKAEERIERVKKMRRMKSSQGRKKGRD